MWKCYLELWSWQEVDIAWRKQHPQISVFPKSDYSDKSLCGTWWNLHLQFMQTKQIHRHLIWHLVSSTPRLTLSNNSTVFSFAPKRFEWFIFFSDVFNISKDGERLVGKWWLNNVSAFLSFLNIFHRSNRISWYICQLVCFCLSKCSSPCSLVDSWVWFVWKSKTFS